MNVLLVGGGAREHALAWKIRRDRPDTRLFLAPGNDGSGQLGQRLDVSSEDVERLLACALQHAIDLTVIGPEGPLAAGIVDRFTAAGLAIFGPVAAAAQIEASKAWAKAFMQRHHIPTARFSSCTTLAEAEAVIGSFERPPVVKDDALAGGKGVTVAATHEEAVGAARDIFELRRDAQVVVEERLEGWELSAMAFCDGMSASLMPPACDYKRLDDGDRGPNTGGMGAYAPAAISAELRRQIMVEVVEPTLRGLAAEGRPFRGVLYPGLMITARGPKVLEFNCRFGDPEAQALLPLLRSDLLDVLLACIQGRLAEERLVWSDEACCAVVLASAGYPEASCPTTPSGCDSLPAGAMAFRGGRSGRVLTVSATGASLTEARRRAYDAVARVGLPGGRHRSDIAAHDRATPRGKG